MQYSLYLFHFTLHFLCFAYFLKNMWVYFHVNLFSALMNEHHCAVTVIFLKKDTLEFSLAAFTSFFN